MTDHVQNSDEVRRRRILFRATHRGSHETDLLVGGFVRDHIDCFGPAELDAIEEIMELLDADLADWLTGRKPIPDAVRSPMLEAIRAAAFKRASGA
jgi:antitoxin CptB